MSIAMFVRHMCKFLLYCVSYLIPSIEIIRVNIVDYAINVFLVLIIIVNGSILALEHIIISDTDFISIYLITPLIDAFLLLFFQSQHWVLYVYVIPLLLWSRFWYTQVIHDDMMMMISTHRRWSLEINIFNYFPDHISCSYFTTSSIILFSSLSWYSYHIPNHHTYYLFIVSNRMTTYQYLLMKHSSLRQSSSLDLSISSSHKGFLVCSQSHNHHHDPITESPTSSTSPQDGLRGSKCSSIDNLL